MSKFRLDNLDDSLLPLAFGGIRVLLLLAVGYVLSLIINRLIRAVRDYSVRAMSRHGTNGEVQKRADTVASVARRFLLTLLWAVLVMMSLQELGFKIGPLLAGAGISAGIIGVAVGFGAQSLVKDIIAGLFLLVENQIRVNDVAVINGTGGLVEAINLRTTVLRGENGAVYIIPNGSIQTLANLTREYSYYVVEITLNHGQDPEKAMGIMQEVAAGMRADGEYSAAILDDLDMMGIDRITPAGLVVKARIRTLPIEQWRIGREMLRRLRGRFLAEGVEWTYEPTGIRFSDRDELKAAIREVLGELNRPGPKP